MPSRTTGESLRARKQRRTRDAIVRAAYELFATRGFDDVTVAEIAERAEVGRTTFFRYFGDKQEVLFAEDSNVVAGLAAHIRGAAAGGDPLGESLAAAVTLVRDAAVAALTAGPSAHPERTALQLRLLARHPDLHGRYLLKQEQQIAVLADALADCGASPTTAALAPQLALACLRAAAQLAGDDMSALSATFDDTIARLLALGSG